MPSVMNYKAFYLVKLIHFAVFLLIFYDMRKNNFFRKYYTTPHNRINLIKRFIHFDFSTRLCYIKERFI